MEMQKARKVLAVGLMILWLITVISVHQIISFEGSIPTAIVLAFMYIVVHKKAFEWGFVGTVFRVAGFGASVVVGAIAGSALAMVGIYSVTALSYVLGALYVGVVSHQDNEAAVKRAWDNMWNFAFDHFGPVMVGVWIVIDFPGTLMLINTRDAQTATVFAIISIFHVGTLIFVINQTWSLRLVICNCVAFVVVLAIGSFIFGYVPGMWLTLIVNGLTLFYAADEGKLLRRFLFDTRKKKEQ
jgi:hypothetical protein